MALDLLVTLMHHKLAFLCTASSVQYGHKDHQDPGINLRPSPFNPSGVKFKKSYLNLSPVCVFIP